MNEVLVLLFSAGAAAFLTALVQGIRSLRSQRAESEEAIIRRLNESATSAHREAMIQRRRAERAEATIDKLRRERDDALERAARFYRKLVEAGLVTKQVDDNEDDTDG